MTPQEYIRRSKEAFASDPFGYGALGWHKWGMAQTLAGFPVNLAKGPTSDDLKSPVLWLSHAHAMAEAARAVLQGTPNLKLMPEPIRGVTHCQYHAVALMLIGYSLEICLKAMLIINKGVAAYQAEEKKYYHHSLERLAEFVPGLNAKDKAVLSGLSHFVRWAGRYPDPGFGKDAHANEIFRLSERHRITAKEVFEVATKVMGYSREIVDSKS